MALPLKQARAAMAIEVALNGNVLEEGNLSTVKSPVAALCCRNSCGK